MLNGKIDGFQFPVNFSHHPILRGTENTSHQKKRIEGLGKKDIRTLAQMAFPISDSFSESVGHLLTKVGLKCARPCVAEHALALLTKASVDVDLKIPWFIMVYHGLSSFST